MSLAWTPVAVPSYRKMTSLSLRLPHLQNGPRSACPLQGFVEGADEITSVGALLSDADRLVLSLLLFLVFPASSLLPALDSLTH